MLSRFMLGVTVLTAVVSQGCGADHSEEIAALQKQVAVLARQIEETSKQESTLQEGQQQLRELVGSLEVEVNRLKPREIARPVATPPVSKEQEEQGSAVPAPVKPELAKVSCARVWKLLGQGKDESAVARSLGTSEAAVQACSRMVGRRGARR
jgi:hypothetical protein